MTSNGSNITKDMSPVEAAQLLKMLEAGHHAAWQATHEARWQTTEYESRLQNAAEIDGVFRDVLWETFENGMRRPGEAVAEFAERAKAQARLADARGADAEPPICPIAGHADADAAAESNLTSSDAIAARLLSGTSKSEPARPPVARSGWAVMTEITLGEPTRIPEPMFAWIGRRQQELSARAHAKGDEQARRCGWTVTVTTGRFGFEARSYRDNRFDDRRHQQPPRIGHRRAAGESALTPVGGPDVISGHQNEKTSDYQAEREAGE